MKKRVLSVGNCGPDHRALSAMIESQFEAAVVAAHNLQETLEHLRSSSCDLVLVNRILDQDGSSGLDLIRQLKTTADVSHVPVMMITNFVEHQQLAEQAGALEGFGKLALRDPATQSKLAAILS